MLLQRLTGRSRLPFNGFDGLNPRVKIGLMSEPGVCSIDQQATTLYITQEIDCRHLQACVFNRRVIDPLPGSGSKDSD
jgi:hypothetical protein